MKLEALICVEVPDQVADAMLAERKSIRSSYQVVFKDENDDQYSYRVEFRMPWKKIDAVEQ